MFRASNGSGAVRISVRRRRHRATLELMAADGTLCQVQLAMDELRCLAGTCMKVAAALAATEPADEVTQS